MAVLVAPDAQGFGQVRAVDIGDFNMAITVQIGRGDGGQPAMRAADMGRGGEFGDAGGCLAIDGQLRPLPRDRPRTR